MNKLASLSFLAASTLTVLAYAESYSSLNYYVCGYEADNPSGCFLWMQSSDNLTTHTAGSLSDVGSVNKTTEFESANYENGKITFGAATANASSIALKLADSIVDVDYFYIQQPSTNKGDGGNAMFWLITADGSTLMEHEAGCMGSGDATCTTAQTANAENRCVDALNSVFYFNEECPSDSTTSNPTSLTELSALALFDRPESVIHDDVNDKIYVSNIHSNNWDNSDPSTQGWISKLSGDFESLDQKWISGIDSPKGMGIYNGKLYVADIDKLRQIDIDTGVVETSYDAPSGYNYLNDVTVCGNGDVFVSEYGYAIMKLSDGTLEPWLSASEATAGGASLDNLNGLYAENETLVFGSGNSLYRIDMSTKAISTITTALPSTDNDGIAGDGNNGYYVTDYNTYAIYHVRNDGSVATLTTLTDGIADLWYRTDNNRLYVPTFNGDSVIMYEPK